MNGQEVDGGSTIPQQLTKNPHLSEDRSARRKLLDAGISMPIAWTVPDARIMELYVNYAQLGPKIYGICAASWYYFRFFPWSLTQYQATSALFQVVAQRYLKTSIVITTNRSVSEWGEVLGDTTVAAAMLDRMLHRSVVLKLDGDSYRLRDHHAQSENHRNAVSSMRRPLQ